MELGISKSQMSESQRKFFDYYKIAIKSTKTMRTYLDTLNLLETGKKANGEVFKVGSKSRQLQVDSVINKAKAAGIKVKQRCARYDVVNKNIKENRKEKVLTREQFDKFLEYLPKRDGELTEKAKELQLACELSINTGMRLSEVLAVTPRDISEAPNNKAIKKIKVQHGKGEKIRTVFLPSSLNHLLDGFKGFTIKDYYVKTTVKNTAKKTADAVGVCDDFDFKKLSFHAFRHTFASKLLSEKNATLPDVQALLGHSDISTTMLYVHVDEDRLTSLFV